MKDEETVQTLLTVGSNQTFENRIVLVQVCLGQGRDLRREVRPQHGLNHDNAERIVSGRQHFARNESGRRQF